MSKNYTGVNLFKFIFSIFVVILHTLFIKYSSEKYSYIFANILNISVPYFFMASGFFIARKFNDDFYAEDNFKRMRNKLKTFVKIYIIWTIIYLPITLFDYFTNDKSIFFNIVSFIRGFIFVGEQFDSWHLWYLLSLIYSLILIMFMQKRKVSKNKMIFIAMLLFFIGFITNNFIVENSIFPNIVNKAIKIYKYIFPNGRIFTGCIYLLIGIIIATKKTYCFNNIYIGLGILLLYALIDIKIFSVLLILVTIFIFENSLKVNINEKLSEYLNIISKVTYFLHMMIFFIYTYSIGQINQYGILSFCVTILFSLLASIFIIIIKKIKSYKNIMEINENEKSIN